MKNCFKIFIFALIIILTAANILTAQGITYYSLGNLPPELTKSWISEINGETRNPTDFTSGDIFIIRSGHRMVTTGKWNISGEASELWIESGGILEAKHPVNLSADTRFFIDDGGKYIHNYSENSIKTPAIFCGINNFRNNSTVEILKWNYSKETDKIAELPEEINWGNLIIKFYPQRNNWNLFNSMAVIQGSFILDVDEEDNIIFFGNGEKGLTIRIGEDFIIKKGTLQFTSYEGKDNKLFILDIGGNFQQTGGFFGQNRNSEPLTINLKGYKKIFKHSGGKLDASNINWVIDISGEYILRSNIEIGLSRSFNVSVLGVLDCGSYSVSGDGAFTLCRGATIKTSNRAGINGSITVKGIKTFTPVTTNYEFYGASPQETGMMIPSVVNDLTINNSSDEGVTLTKSITVGKTLYMTKGKIKMKENVELTLGGNK